MSVYATPEEHAANPPETWEVRRVDARHWHVVDQQGTVLHRAQTKTEAGYAIKVGFIRNLYDQETRWFAGEQIPGWRPWSEVRAENALTLVNGLRADLHEPSCPGMDEDGNWLGDCDCAAIAEKRAGYARTYDEQLHKVGDIEDDCHDRTTVLVDGTEVHVTVMDQTMSDGLDEDHEPDGGWPDMARGVYSIDQAIELRDFLTAAIDKAMDNHG